MGQASLCEYELWKDGRGRQERAKGRRVSGGLVGMVMRGSWQEEWAGRGLSNLGANGEQAEEYGVSCASGVCVESLVQCAGSVGAAGKHVEALVACCGDAHCPRQQRVKYREGEQQVVHEAVCVWVKCSAVVCSKRQSRQTGRCLCRTW